MLDVLMDDMKDSMKKTILLVEDEALIAAAEEQMLVRHGYAVITALTDKEAVEAAMANDNIDLVLMDIDLGSGMDGTQAAEIILRSRDIPVVFLSSHMEPDIVEKTEKITSYGYVVKNTGDTVLLASIRMAFRLHEARSREREKEKALRESMQTSDDIVRAIPSGLFIYQYEAPDKLVLLDGNPEAENLTGMRIGEWRGREFNEIWPEARAAGVTDAYLEVVKTGRMFKSENLYYSDERIINYVFRIHAFLMPGKKLGVAFENITELRNKELALRESEENLVKAQHIAHLGSWEWNIAHNRVTWSDEMYRIFGIAKESFTGWLPDIIVKAIHPDDRGRVEESNRSVVENSTPVPLEYRIVLPDGSVRWVWAEAGEFILGRSGKPYLLRGIVLDITERKKIEAQLRESDRHLRYIFDNAIIGMFISTPEGKFIYTNRELSSILGYDSPEELMRVVNATSIAEALYEDPQRRPRMVEEVEKDQGRWKIYENRYRRKDGKIIDAVLSFCEAKNPATGELLLYGFVQDVTSRKLAEESLRLQHATMTAAANGIVITDCAGTIKWANPAFTKLTGYAPEEAIGKNPRDLVRSGVQDEEYYRKLWDTILSGEVWRGELVNRRRDGSLYSEEMTITPVRDEHGKITNFIAVKQDITERIRNGKEMEALTQRMSAIFENASEGIVTLDADRVITMCNRAAADILGYPKEELIGQSLRKIYRSGEYFLEVGARAYPAIRGQGIYRGEVEILRGDGKERTCEISISRLGTGEDSSGVVGMFRDVTDEKNNRKRMQLLTEMIDAASSSITVLDRDGNFLYANRKTFELYGHDETGFMALNVLDIDPHATAKSLEEMMDIIEKNGEAVFEVSHKMKDGTVFPLEVISKKVDWGGVPAILNIADEIIERKEAEREREALVHILGIFNVEQDLRELMKAVCLYLQEWSGCEAIGIRLREGEDYHYFETRGFPAEFVRLENSLCTLDLHGQLLRDDIGSPVIECMCGNVICGRFDPSKPFFTGHGSFWSNCTTELLASTTDAERQTRTRNHCNGMGYESVALIPLRVGETTFGLLQLNDTRKGRFSAGMISSLERLCDSMAIALSRRTMVDELLETTEILNHIRKAQSLFIIGSDPGETYRVLLESLIRVTGSEFGFLDEVLHDADGTPYMLSLSITNISWNEESRRLYRELVGRRLEFRNLNNLSGLPVLTGETVISNNPADDPRAGGLPDGHPPLRSYMGIPMYFAGDLVGVAGVANREGGYTPEIAERLAPLISTCAGIIHSFKRDEIVKAREALLRESEEKFRTVADFTYDWEFWMDPDGNLKYVSPSCERITGYAPGEFLHDPGLMTAIVHPEDRVAYMDHNREICENHVFDEKGIDFRITRKDGGLIWIANRCRPVYDNDIRFLGIRGSNRDITERRSAEERILKEREGFYKILSAAPVGLMLLNRDTIITQTNRSFLNMVLKEPAEVIGKRGGGGLGCVHSDEDPRGCGFSKSCPDCPLWKTIEGVLAENTSAYNVEVAAELLIGGVKKKRWLSVSAEPVDLDGARYAIVAVDDITERKSVEREIRKNIQKFDLLAWIAGELLKTQDPEVTVGTFCRRVMEYLDCHVFFNFLADDDSSRLRLNAYAGIPEEEAERMGWLDYGIAVCAAREGRRIIAEHIPDTPDERTELVKSYGIRAYACHPLVGEGGRVLGTLSFGTRGRDAFSDEDIALMNTVADHVAMAIVRSKSSRMLARSAEEKQSLLQELQHRIKNTLVMITSLANLEADSADDPAVREAMDNIRGRISSLSSLYTILHASGESREVHLDQYVRAIGDSVLAAYVPEGTRIDLEVRTDDIVVNTRKASSLGLLLNELLMNAFKYAFKGRDRGMVSITLRGEEDHLLLEVSDDGTGLPGDFDPEKSRGLGIRLVMMLTKQMKGFFEFENGEGTTFRVKVPLG